MPITEYILLQVFLVFSLLLWVVVCREYLRAMPQLDNKFPIGMLLIVVGAILIFWLVSPPKDLKSSYSPKRLIDELHICLEFVFLTSTFLLLFNPSAYKFIDSNSYFRYNSMKYELRISLDFWQIQSSGVKLWGHPLKGFG